MPKLERQFYERTRGGHLENEDWWTLVFDTDAKRIYVEHTWSHKNPWKAGHNDSGARSTEVNEFLKSEGPGRVELAALLEGMFGHGA